MHIRIAEEDREKKNTYKSTHPNQSDIVSWLHAIRMIEAQNVYPIRDRRVNVTKKEEENYK